MAGSERIYQSLVSALVVLLVVIVTSRIVT